MTGPGQPRTRSHLVYAPTLTGVCQAFRYFHLATFTYLYPQDGLRSNTYRSLPSAWSGILFLKFSCIRICTVLQVSPVCCILGEVSRNCHKAILQLRILAPRFEATNPYQPVYSCICTILWYKCMKIVRRKYFMPDQYLHVMSNIIIIMIILQVHHHDYHTPPAVC